MDLTLWTPCCCICCADDDSDDCELLLRVADCSAVSSVVGRSISRWIWMPSPGPMCEMWLKFEGAEMSFERRSGFL